jgi:hypothetical protein
MLQSGGLDFALPEDCAKAALRIATDCDINGKRASLRDPVTHPKMNDIGRAFAIVPRQVMPEGYVDIDHDDAKEGTLLYSFEAAGNMQAQNIGSAPNVSR